MWHRHEDGANAPDASEWLKIMLRYAPRTTRRSNDEKTRICSNLGGGVVVFSLWSSNSSQWGHPHVNLWDNLKILKKYHQFEFQLKWITYTDNHIFFKSYFQLFWPFGFFFFFANPITRWKLWHLLYMDGLVEIGNLYSK